MEKTILALFAGFLLVAPLSAEARKGSHHKKKLKKKAAARSKKAFASKQQREQMAKDRAADQNGEKQLAELRSARELTVQKDAPIPGLQERDGERPR